MKRSKKKRQIHRRAENPWEDYERAKRDLQRENLPPEDYERRLKEIVKELGL